MLFVIVLYLLLNKLVLSNTLPSNVGTCLFSKERDVPSDKCWTPKEIAILHARQIFEQMVPKQMTPDKIDTKYVKQTLKYFKRAVQEVEKCNNIETRDILLDALSDTLGSHLRSHLLPAVRYAFYAGFIQYREVRRLHDFFDELKLKLNTQGIGWQEPRMVPLQPNITVGRIMLGTPAFTDPCKFLIVSRTSDSCFHLPTPKMDDEKQPSAIALPFRNTALIGLCSPIAESAVLRYYQTAARCILHSSPPKCRHTDFVNYHSDMWQWLQGSVAPHLADEKLYSAYGGVLRVAASVQTYGKGLKRRNLYDKKSIRNDGVPYFNNLNLDQHYYQLTPGDYIRYMLILALCIVSCQFLYHYTIGNGRGCNCQWPEMPEPVHLDGDEFPDASYSKATSKIPAMPSKSEDHNSLNVSKPGKVVERSIKSSIRTEKVYDLNKDQETMMTFIEESDAGSLTDSEKATVLARRTPGNPSLVIPARLQIEDSRQLYPIRSSYRTRSTSTESTYKITYVTDYDSSSSTGSSSSMVSQPQRLKRTKSSRDLAWARRVVTEQMIRSKIMNDNSHSRADYSSHTTLTSKI